MLWINLQGSYNQQDDEQTHGNETNEDRESTDHIQSQPVDIAKVWNTSQRASIFLEQQEHGSRFWKPSFLKSLMMVTMLESDLDQMQSRASERSEQSSPQNVVLVLEGWTSMWWTKHDVTLMQTRYNSSSSTADSGIHIHNIVPMNFKSLFKNAAINTIEQLTLACAAHVCWSFLLW